MILDWVDTPKEALVETVDCRSFHVEHVRPLGGSSLYRLWPLDAAAFPRAWETLTAALGTPPGDSWIPKWEFQSKEVQKEVEHALDHLITHTGDRVAYVQSADVLKDLIELRWIRAEDSKAFEADSDSALLFNLNRLPTAPE